MSHRTEGLSTLSGAAHVLRELRYHEASRQVLAGALILLYTMTARGVAWLVWAGAPMVLTGTLIRCYASGFITKNEELATRGPYALARHPLYTGNILIILGFSVANGFWWAVPSALFFFWFYYPCAIEYEDRKLRKLFGEQWERWAGAVPALAPTLRNFSAVGGGSWSLAKSARQNGEPILLAFILFCLSLLVRQIV